MDRLSDGLITRRALELAEESLADFRVLVVHGARQVGKTTLARALATQIDAGYVSLDDIEVLAAAASDPPRSCGCTAPHWSSMRSSGSANRWCSRSRWWWTTTTGPGDSS